MTIDFAFLTGIIRVQVQLKAQTEKSNVIVRQITRSKRYQRTIVGFLFIIVIGTGFQFGRLGLKFMNFYDTGLQIVYYSYVIVAGLFSYQMMKA